MRVFYLEPFLRRVESHFIEFALAVYGELKTNPLITAFIVGHRGMTPGVPALFPEVIPGISQTCFEDVDDAGRSFLSDLMELDTRFHFTQNDLVIIPTAYENQVLGAGRFANATGTRCPMIALHFHQLFPPWKESDILYSLRFRRHWMARLRRAFSTSASSRLSYWTTESRHLNAAYRHVTGRPVGVLPVPSSAGGMGRRVPSSNCPRMGYVGDGRQEKGLLQFLKACNILNGMKPGHEFILQLNNPRGFTEEQQTQLQHELASFRAMATSRVIEGGLPPTEHHALINEIDVLVLPYNPINYWRRISGLLIQAALQQCVVVVSSGTWAADAIRKGRAAGVIFQHEGRNDDATVANLCAAMSYASDNYPVLAKQAASNGAYYQHLCQPRIYVERLLRHYECTQSNDRDPNS